jgi:hypothetical protein
MHGDEQEGGYKLIVTATALFCNFPPQHLLAFDNDDAEIFNSTYVQTRVQVEE